MKLNVPIYERIILIDPYSENPPLRYNYQKDTGKLKVATSKISIDLGQKTTLIVCSEKLLIKEMEIDPELPIEQLLSNSFVGLSPNSVYACTTSNSVSIIQQEVLNAYLNKWFQKLPVIQQVLFLKSELEPVDGSLEHVMERLPEWSEHNVEALKTTAEEHAKRTQTSKRLLIGASILLLLVMGTKMTNGFLQNQIAGLELTHGQSQKDLNELKVRNENLDVRVAQLEALGINGESEIIRLGQAVLEDIPRSITLKELHLKPIALKGEGSTQEIQYENNVVKVAGSTSSSFDLNNWVRTLKEHSLFEEIDVTYQMKKRTAVFQLIITLHG